MTSYLPGHNPERMSRRARKYLVAVGNRHALLAILFLGFPQFFKADVYHYIRDMLPFAQLWLWGIACAAVAVTNWTAAYTQREWWAWRGLLGAFVLTSIMAMAYAITWGINGLPAPVVTVTLIYVARKDYIQLGDPLRSPFDPVVEVFAGPEVESAIDRAKRITLVLPIWRPHRQR